MELRRISRTAWLLFAGLLAASFILLVAIYALLRLDLFAKKEPGTPAQASCANAPARQQGVNEYKVWQSQVYQGVNTISDLSASTCSGWNPFASNQFISTDANGEAELNFAQCWPGRIFIFQDSAANFQTAACRQAEYGASAACVMNGTWYTGECASAYTLNTPSARITKRGTTISVTYLDERQLTLVIVLKGAVEVEPLQTYHPTVLAPFVPVPEGHFLFTMPDEKLNLVAAVIPRTAQPLELLPAVAAELGIENWIFDVASKATQDGLLPANWPPSLGGIDPNRQATPNSEVVAFTADRIALLTGECTTLRWEAANSQDVLLNGQAVASAGEYQVCPSVTNIYELAVNQNGQWTWQRLEIAIASVPADGSGTGVTPSAIAQLPLGFTFAPASGPPGTRVQIDLNQAVQQASVYYNGLPLLHQLSPDRRTLWATLPTNASDGYFALITNLGTASSTQPFRITSAPAPIITPSVQGNTPTPAVSFSFMPTSGPPGSAVSITLSRAVKNAAVYYNGQAIPSTLGTDGVSLSTSIPAGAASGTFSLIADNLVVNNSQQFTVLDVVGGQSPGQPEIVTTEPPTQPDTIVTETPPLSFTFQPLSGPPGTQVEIIPNQPLDQAAIFYNGAPLDAAVQSNGSLLVTIPPGAQSAYLELHWNDLVAFGSQPFQVTPIIITTEPPPPPTSTLILWYQVDTGVEAVLGSLLEDIQAQNPDLLIEAQPVKISDLQSYAQHSAAGEGPDLILGANAYLQDWVSQGAVLDLTPYLGEVLSSFQTNAVQGLNIAGAQYGIPHSIQSVGLQYYNSAFLTPPASTDEMLSVSVHFPPIIYLEPYLLTGWAQAFGGQITDASGQCIADQMPAWLDYLNYLLALQENGAAFINSDPYYQGFASRGAPLLLGYSAHTDELSLSLGTELGLAPLPGGPAGPAVSPLTVSGFFVNPNSSNPQAAVDLALYLTDQAAAQRWVDQAGLVPVRGDITLSDPLLIAQTKLAANGLGINAWPQGFLAPFTALFDQVLLQGVDPLEALQQACKIMNDARGNKPITPSD